VISGLLLDRGQSPSHTIPPSTTDDSPLRGHCRRSRRAGVHPAEIVVRDVDRDRRGQILQLLAEAQGQPGKAFHQGLRRQVHPFHVVTRISTMCLLGRISRGGQFPTNSGGPYLPGWSAFR